MNCPARYLLQRLLADRLDGTDLADVEAHVEECTNCQKVLEELTEAAAVAGPQRGEAPGQAEGAAAFLMPLMKGPPPPGFRSSHGNGLAPSTTKIATGRPVPAIAGYEMLEELGRGASGVVYKARQVASERLVAVKVLRRSSRSGFSVRFRREVQALAWLQHPHIVRIYEVGEHEGRPFLAMELAHDSLDRRLRLGALAWPAAVRLVADLACAVQTAHEQGIIHRDLKPANIMLVNQPAASFPVGKIADFGLAKGKTDTVKYTHVGSIIGTPCYMAPEQASAGSAEIGPAADIYSLGAILYETLAGRPPFQGTTVPEVLELVRSTLPPPLSLPGLPPELNGICQKCLNKEPGERYGSALELAQELERVLQSVPTVCVPSLCPPAVPSELSGGATMLEEPSSATNVPARAPDLHSLGWYQAVELPGPVERGKKQRRLVLPSLAFATALTLIGLLTVLAIADLVERAAHPAVAPLTSSAPDGSLDVPDRMIISSPATRPQTWPGGLTTRPLRTKHAR